MERGDIIEVWTDGACKGNPGPGGWAAVISAHGGDEEVMVSGRKDFTTNNEMEMVAVLHALAKAREGSTIRINTDSKLVIGWLARGWKAKANWIIPDLIEAITTLRDNKGLTVYLKMVKGHAGIPGNEKADQRASLEAQLAQQERQDWIKRGSPGGMPVKPS